MRLHLRCLLAAFAVLTFVVVISHASFADDKPQPDPNEPQVTRLVLHPAEPPAVAMKHRLLPRYLDLVPGNAAVQYLKAALPDSGGPRVAEAQDKLADLLDQPRDKFDIEQARKLLHDEIGNTLFEYLRWASIREECEWNLPIREQQLFSILLPEVQQLRTYGRYLAVRARMQIAEGKFEDAVETLRVGYALARNIVRGPTLIHALVGGAITSMLNKQLLELIESPAAPNLYWSIAALPEPFIDVRRAIDLESDGIYLIFPQLKGVATANLTEQQWTQRLAELGTGLSTLAPQDIPEDNRIGDWKEKLARGVGAAGMATLYYHRAKADLEKYGWPKADLDRMAMAQVVLLHMNETYEILRDDMFKWFHIPYWQADEAMQRVDDNVKSIGKDREILPLAALLLPAINASRSAIVRVDRQFAAIRTVEALRFYAARHDGKLPEKLDDIKEVPVPLDPVTGGSFDYKLDGQTATLEGLYRGSNPPKTGGVPLHHHHRGEESRRLIVVGTLRVPSRTRSVRSTLSNPAGAAAAGVGRSRVAAVLRQHR